MRRLALLLTLFIGVHAAPAVESPAPRAGEAKTVRLLTIGNSFSANATKYLGDLVKAGGHTSIHRPIVVGGTSMDLHATKAQAHERDPADKAGLYTAGHAFVPPGLGADNARRLQETAHRAVTQSDSK